ncbi:MAG TPA: VOC family protein [Herpetosiphonaceae bacterium]
MLRGLSTVSFWADDVAAARQWYAELLGIEAYFNVPNPDGSTGYSEFRIGDYQHELGLIDRRYATLDVTATRPAGAIVYWHVDDLNAALERLLAMGATQLDAPTRRGEGFVTASVVDPFGNVLGIMYNQHYLDMLGARHDSEHS